MTHDTEGFRVMNRELLELAAEGKILALISERFDLENIVEAMRLLLSRNVVGKIVIRTNP